MFIKNLFVSLNVNSHSDEDVGSKGSDVAIDF